MTPHVSPQRFPEIDLLRTLAIVMMIVYHIAYDLHVLHGWNIDMASSILVVFQRTTASLFIGITGVSFMLSREKMLRRHTSINTMAKRWFMRSLTIFSCAILVSIATFIFDPSHYVRFGILHMIATSLLLLPLFSRIGVWNIVMGIIVIAIGVWLHGSVANTFWLLPFGVMPMWFSSMDYFPLFPWFGVTLLGVGLCSLLYLQESVVSRFWGTWRLKIDILHKRSMFLRSLSLPGAYSLWIYMIHQPIIIGVLWVIVFVI